jgi:CHAT domain-containing protein
LVSLVSWSAVNARGSVPQEGIRVLELGQPIERELKGGESHSYQIALAAGQYVHVVAEQIGIDVVVKVFGPDGKLVMEVDSPNGTQGPEPVMLVADIAGTYRLEVSSLEKDAKAGRYEAKLVELRTATQRDRDQIAAERALAEGKSLSAQGSKASNEAAIRKFEEAQLLYRASGDQKKEASMLNYIGNHLLLLGQPQKALECFTQALSLAHSLGDRGEEANGLNNVAAAHSLLGEYQKALGYFNQSLPLSRSAGNRNVEASTLFNIGYINNELSEYQKALDYYNQALQLFRALGDRKGEAVTLNGIAVVYSSLGERQKELDYSQKALALQRDLGDRGREAVTLHNIGAAYHKLSEYQKALDYSHPALQLFRMVGDRQGEANTISLIGATYSSLDENQKALDYYHQALPLHRAIGDRQGEAKTLHNLGSAYRSLEEKQKALEYYQQSLLLWRSLSDRYGEAAALANIGTVYERLGERQKALDHYSQALALARAIRSPEREEPVLSYQARVNRDLGNLAEARRLMEASLNIIESLRVKVAGQELRSSFFASRQDHYEFYLDLLMGLHQRQPGEGIDAAALQAGERARARSLLELLAEANVDIRQGVDPQLLARERALRQQLSAKAAAQTALLNGKHTEAQAAAAAKEIAATTAQLQEVEAQIRANSPSYAALTQPQPLSLAEVQQQVLNEDTLLLEYALGRERSYLWAVTPTSIASHQLPPRAEIEAAARKVYDLLAARQPRPGETEAQLRARTKAADTEYLTRASLLSRMLLSPVAEQLGSKRLLIVADGALQYLPFATLPAPALSGQTTGEAEPLIVKHEVVNLPSASTLAVLRRELAGRQPATRAVAVLADPVFAPDDARVRLSLASKKSPGAAQSQTAESTPSDLAVSSALERAIRSVRGASGATYLRRLLFSRDEAEAILAVAPQPSGLKALDFRANRALALSEELREYRIIHFATHGLLDSQRPELSGLVLSLVDEAGRPQDGFLRLHEVYNLRLNADLVVLSACQTGLGKEVRGEGLVGLVRGFMYAGTPRVVASLWQVDDAATSALMKRFYRGMVQEQLSPAAALRAAQLEMLKRKQWQSPYFWGAFVLQGEWK